MKIYKILTFFPMLNTKENCRIRDKYDEIPIWLHIHVKTSRFEIFWVPKPS